MTRTMWKRRLALSLALALLGYLVFAYALLPLLWREEDAGRPVPAAEMVTRTGDGRPGDPLNIVFDASPEALVSAFGQAGWSPANAITFETSLRIVESIAFDRPDADAPVSPLYYDGRREDLAFEKPVGTSADRREHVRLWRVNGPSGPLYVGAVTFDAGVGFSHYTGAVTHRIAPDIDAARAALAADLEATGAVSKTQFVPGIVATTGGRNGEGDPYETDGRALELVLSRE